MVACVSVSQISEKRSIYMTIIIRREDFSRFVPTADYKAENKFMQMAIDEARTGIFCGHGGPFGSVIVNKDGIVIGKGHNRVVLNNDSTCHGEIAAIRDAESNIKSFDLSGCVIYTTGEPCPMCLSACMWANIETIYYGCNINDNAIIGFRDALFFKKFGNRADFSDYLVGVDREACLKLFNEYKKIDSVKY